MTVVEKKLAEADAPSHLRPLPFQPLIILGAGRSGTNILRDMITHLQGAETWPCDEINPIWRHGNTYWPNDEIPAERASITVRNYIRSAFVKQWKNSNRPEILVEKTCANSLRVPFVNAIFPEALFVYVVRNGHAVVPSAVKRWRGDLEVRSMPYFLSKARYVPIVDLPYYAVQFLKSRIKMLGSSDKRLSLWGPRFEAIDEAEKSRLEEVCALQWAECVNLTDKGLEQISPERIFYLKYEEMTSSPEKIIRQVSQFLELNSGERELSEGAAMVRRQAGNKNVPATNYPDSVQKKMNRALKNHSYAASDIS
jgi:hypothetical protein